jgi:MOSC domain-containing protein YiiM
VGTPSNQKISGSKSIKIVSIALSKRKGTRKIQVRKALVVEGHGIQGDAHAGAWHRQISFLDAGQIEKCRADGLDVSFGDFAENIATEGIDWKRVPLGTRLRLGGSAVVEVTQIGKECHKRCAIYYQAGDCIMPREGVFARVLQGGSICCGDAIEFLPESHEAC